jgi:hypothetical protein
MSPPLSSGGGPPCGNPCVRGGRDPGPGRDARGILVVSDPAVSPPGYNLNVPGLGALPGHGSAPVAAASGPLPPCARTVTDRCVQTYERGIRR